MILIMKENKIIGVDKSLLRYLNIDLSKLSELINKIELEISALQNKSFKVNDYEIKAIKKDILSIENIDVYELLPISKEEFVSIEEFEQSKLPEVEEISQELPKIEEELTAELKEIKPEIKELEKITPEIEELKEITPEIEQITPEVEKITPIETPEIEKITPEIKEPETQKETQIATKNIISEEITPQETEIKPQTIEISKPTEISITFEDELQEVEKILNLPKEEAQKLIHEEIKQAASELGIDEEMIKEFVDDLYKQIREEKPTFYAAIANKDYEALHKTAHKLKGAALNLRLSNLAYILKVIDEKSKQKAPISTIQSLVDKFYAFFEKISEKNIPEEIRSIILKTIQEYLEVQNDKKFKKDKKYIEKLLHKTINSIDDLKKLIKGS